MSNQFHYPCRDEPCAHGVSSTGQNDGDSGSEDDARAFCACEVLQLFCEYVASFEVRDQQDVSLTCDWRDDLLHLGGLLANCIVKRKRTVENSTSDLASISHFA